MVSVDRNDGIHRGLDDAGKQPLAVAQRSFRSCARRLSGRPFTSVLAHRDLRRRGEQQLIVLLGERR